jgi:hypothetical protein
MRRMMLVAAAAAALAVGVLSASAEQQGSTATHSGSGVLESLAGNSTSGAVFWTRGMIDRLALDGSLVAASTYAIEGSCDRIVVWTAPGKEFTSFDTRVGCPDGFPNFWFVRELALGAGRIAWIEVVAGNEQEMYLYQASASGGPSRKLETAYNGYGAKGDWAGDWIGQLFGSGSILAYNHWTLCSWLLSNDEPTAECPVEGQVSAATLAGVSPDGRPVRLRMGQDVFRLRAVAGGRLAVEPMSRFRPGYDTGNGGRYGPGFGTASGEILVLSQTGRIFARVPAAPERGAPRAIELSSTQLVMQRRSTIDVHSSDTGKLIRTIPLGATQRMKLVGANTRLAVLSGLHRLVVVRLSDGKRANLRLPEEAMTGASPISPRLSEVGLVYAYNVANTPAKGRIVYTPTDEMLAHFR